MDKKDFTLLRRSSVFQSLSDREFDAVASMLQPRQFANGEQLLGQEKAGEGMYVIRSGKVSMQAALPGNALVEFCQLSPGEACGQTSLVGGGGRTATAVAIGDLKCFVLTRDHLHMFYYSDPKVAYRVFRAIIADVCRRINDVYELLAGQLDDFQGGSFVLNESEQTGTTKKSIKETPYDAEYLHVFEFFNEFSLSEVNTLLGYMDFLHAPKGYKLCGRGEKGDAAYIIVQGAVHVLIEQGGVVSKLGLIGPGHVVGEVVLIGECGHISNCYVREMAYLLRLTRASMDALEAEHMELWYKLHRTLCKLLVYVLRSADRQLIRLNSQRYFSEGA